VGEASFEHGGIHFTLRAYQITILPGDFSCREHSEYRWVTAEELEELDFAGSDKLLFPNLKALLGVSP
jgi:8-oxo-dGTP pyrophosphatase MutT (NUDIX family)